MRALQLTLDSLSSVCVRHRFRLALGLAGAAIALGVVTGCGGDGGRDSSTGADIPIGESSVVGARPGAEDAYEHPNAAADAYTFVTPLGGNRYRLEVTNTSSRGFINKFTWFPGPGTTIVSVTGARLAKNGGEADCRLDAGKISCEVTLRPPKCTCRGDGGTVAIDFTATRDKSVRSAAITFGSDLFVEAETLVPYFIPSTPDQKPSDLADLPICAAGHTSTAAKPCLAAG
jgi:hypothetical protein